MIKRVIRLLALFMIILLSGCGSGYANTAQVLNIKDNGALKVAIREGVKGFCINTQTGYEGLEVDLAALLTKEILGNTEDYILVPSSNYTRLHYLTLKEADVTIALLEETEERSKNYAFSSPYYTDVYGFLVRAGGGLQSIDQIANKRIGVLSNSIAETKLKAFLGKKNIEATIVHVGSFPEAVELLSGQEPKIDAFAAESALLRSYINENVIMLTQGYAEADYCIAALKSNEPLVRLADEMLKRMEEDGSLNALIEKWGLK
ncbi:MAG: transporter substrate-binding domain-containing protein [Christensenellales bacterium]